MPKRWMELLKFIATQTTCAIDDRNKNMHALTTIVELKSVDAERECVTTVVLTSTSGGGMRKVRLAVLRQLLRR